MDKNGTNAVNELLATYGETGGINYLAAAATLPRGKRSKRRAPI